MLDDPVEEQGQLVAVDGAPPPRARVGADLLGVDTDLADDGVGPRWPPGWGVVADGDLGPGHPDRRSARPVLLGHCGGGPPHRRVAFRGHGEVTPQPDRRVGQLGGEVPGIAAHHRAVGVAEAGPHLVGQGRDRPGQQRAAVGAHVLHTGAQVRGQGEPGVSPSGQVGAPGALTQVVVGHPAFEAAVDLHVGGVQVDAHPSGEHRSPPPGGKPGPAAGDDGGVTGLDARDTGWAEAAGQPTGGGRGHRRHRREQLRRGVGAVTVHRVDELAVQQLALRQPGHQLTEREHPRRPGQRGVRIPEPHPAASPAGPTASRLPAAPTSA